MQVWEVGWWRERAVSSYTRCPRSCVFALYVPQVIFVAPAETREDLVRLADSSPALRVRGRVVAWWVQHLVKVYKDNPHLLGNHPPPTIDRSRLELVSKLDGVPPQLLQSSVHAGSEAQAVSLLRAFTRGRDGYANTRTGREEDPMLSPEQLERAAAAPPMPGGGLVGARARPLPPPARGDRDPGSPLPGLVQAAEEAPPLPNHGQRPAAPAPPPLPPPPCCLPTPVSPGTTWRLSGNCCWRAYSGRRRWRMTWWNGACGLS